MQVLRYPTNGIVSFEIGLLPQTMRNFATEPKMKHVLFSPFTFFSIHYFYCRPVELFFRNQCINCKVVFGEYHCNKCNLWMSQVRFCRCFNPREQIRVYCIQLLIMFLANSFLSYYQSLRRPKNPSIANNVAFAESEVKKTFGIAPNAVCAFLSMCLKPTVVSRISTKTIVQSVEKTCFPRASLPRICPAVTRYMLTAFAS